MSYQTLIAFKSNWSNSPACPPAKIFDLEAKLLSTGGVTGQHRLSVQDLPLRSKPRNPVRILEPADKTRELLRRKVLCGSVVVRYGAVGSNPTQWPSIGFNLLFPPISTIGLQSLLSPFCITSTDKIKGSNAAKARKGNVSGQPVGVGKQPNCIQ